MVTSKTYVTKVNKIETLSKKKQKSGKAKKYIVHKRSRLKKPERTGSSRKKTRKEREGGELQK